uniref:Uncharacterized protein n=1 Tax=Zea mays TaxID=4577 RepID=C0PI28_MAIZE|nr:unknown [Zea mays]
MNYSQMNRLLVKLKVTIKVSCIQTVICILTICEHLPGPAHEFYIICLATTISLEPVEV